MKIEIKNPCTEDWSKMKIGVVSRHCDVCDKGVVDFTRMDRGEIISYLLAHPNEEVCGRLTRDQFDFHHEDIPLLIEALRKQKHPNPFLVMALVSLSLASCSTPNKGSHKNTNVERTMGEVTIEQQTQGQVEMGKVEKEECVKKPVQINNEEQLMGDTILEPVYDGGIGVIYDEPVQQNEKRVHSFAEKMPEYPGGMDSLQQFIKINLQYPKYERDNNIEGNVYVRFVVETDGSISSVEILRSVEGARNFDEEVLRVIGKMPKWVAGENQGKKVPVYMTLPFTFRLKD